MAEIRVNATGGLKLFDADDSHYAQIVAGTITSNVDAITLGHNIATFNAAITAGGVLKTDDATEATYTTDGSLQTDGGLSVVKDAVFGDDVKLLSDSSVIAFGADGEVTLTHVHNDGLLLNSDNQLQFRDSAINIRSDADGDLDINADDEIELNSTLIDINGNVEISGTATTTGVHTFSATPVFPDGSLALADLDIDGGTDIGAALVDADEIIVDDGGGGTNRRCDMSRVKTYVEDAAGEVPIANLNIDGGTDIGAAVVDADLFIIDDGAGGTNRKETASRIKTYAGGGWTMIKSITASDSTDVQFINGSSSVVLDGTYHIYKLFGINIIPETDTAIPQLHMTTDAGSNWTAVTGSFIAGGGTSGGTTGTPTPEYFATGGFYEPDYGIGSASGEVACFEATVYLPSATNANVLTHISTISQTSNNNRYVGMGMHMANAVENIDGIKIVLSTGDIAAGIFKLYGIEA